MLLHSPRSRTSFAGQQLFDGRAAGPEARGTQVLQVVFHGLLDLDCVEEVVRSS